MVIDLVGLNPFLKKIFH